jgi:nucleotide-binding universal stress UspA family protein
MTEIKKILFPVDFSERSNGAARYVEALAGWFEAEIMLLHVVDTGLRWYPEDAKPHLKQQLDQYLTDELKYFTTERVCVVGDPAEKITEIAKSWGADLVMMPTRGPGDFRRLILGSVTAKVLHDADCPVWTSVHSEIAPPLELIACNKVLCAVDLGPRSAQILDWAAFLAREHQATLGIVHVTPGAQPVPGSFRAPEAASFVAFAVETGIRELQAAAGTDATVLITAGDPAKAVPCAAKEFGADVLVIGRHNGLGSGGHLRRHAYAILRESPCPVISI